MLIIGFGPSQGKATEKNEHRAKRRAGLIRAARENSGTGQRVCEVEAYPCPTSHVAPLPTGVVALTVPSLRLRSCVNDRLHNDKG